MKYTLLSCAGLLAFSGSLMASGLYSASNLYFMGEDATESIPLKWSVGLDVVWDDNVNPTLLPGSIGYEDSGTALNPFVEVAFVNITPQTTMDLYARIGMLYYFDKPGGMSDDTFPDVKVGFNLTHRFNERLRFVTRNYVSWELEPDYSYGFANNRLSDYYVYYSTDNSIGYRWTERFATYTGFRITDYDYNDNFIGANSQDRFMWMVYQTFRYQLTPQTVLTASYRYSQTDAGGIANDSTNQYALLGIEHRFSPTTVGILRGGAQFRDVDGIGGETSTSPYFEGIIRSRINEQFAVRGYLRYGIEDYDTIYQGFLVGLPTGLPVEFDKRSALRLGFSADYAISPRFRMFGGVNYIYSDYEDGRIGLAPVATNPEENLFNIYIGMSMKINDWLYANATYNYTNSDSDILSRDYDRNRVSVGMRAEF